jgi:alpha-amylase/alpha-mannosidase (GH57 family)
MDAYGHLDWIDSLRELVQSEKVELTGSAAYHPLLTKLPETVLEEQIILNEYGLGYYLGRKTGFEGEPSIMIRNLNGFFPPEMAINSSVAKKLDELGYKWVVADECALDGEGDRSGIYSFKDVNVQLVARNRGISNQISFMRTTDIEYLKQPLMKNNVIVLDGETFGHHNKEGILLLENIVDFMHEKGISTVTMSQYLDQISDIKLLDSVNLLKESSWGASDEDMSNGDLYPMWAISGNKVQAEMWDLQDEIVSLYDQPLSITIIEDAETAPIWKVFPSDDIKDRILFHQSLNSDKFWWASDKKLPTGQVLHHPGMVKNSLALWQQLSKADKVKGKVEKLAGSL